MYVKILLVLLVGTKLTFFPFHDTNVHENMGVRNAILFHHLYMISYIDDDI